MLNRMLNFLPIIRVILYVSIVLFFIIVPTEYIEKGPTICLFKNIFKMECLGCGMTRAISSIFHGNFIKAFYYNKLVIVIFPLLVFFVLYDLLFMLSRLFNGKKKF